VNGISKIEAVQYIYRDVSKQIMQVLVEKQVANIPRQPPKDTESVRGFHKKEFPVSVQNRVKVIRKNTTYHISAKSSQNIQQNNKKIFPPTPPHPTTDR
jgi:hypothetical protein